MKVLRKARNQKGAALVEYGLLVGLIAVVAIAAVTGLGGAISEDFTDACNALSSSGDLDGGTGTPDNSGNTGSNGTADGCE